MDSRVTKFIAKHHVLTLATQSDAGVYCANAFYAFDKESGNLIFSTDEATRHGQEMTANPKVAASVVLETRVVGSVKGVQLNGRVERASREERSIYLSKFPYAVALDLTLWRLVIDYAKLTDNTLGFGKKIVWNR